MKDCVSCIKLNGQWKLYYMPESENLPASPEELDQCNAQTIDACVPGNIELDLVRAGIEKDPYFGTNVSSFRKYEFYCWWFVRTFDIPQEMEGKDLILRLDGIDTFGTVFINNQKVGECSNMLIPHEFDITSYVKNSEENTISIHIASSMNKARACEIPVGMGVSEHVGDEYLTIRKAPHSFGWDISGRFLSAGLWRDVWIYAREKTYIKEVYYATIDIAENKAAIACVFRFDTDALMIDDFSVRVSGTCRESRFEKTMKVNFTAGKMFLEVKSPVLWWPKGYGKPELYEMEFQLLRKGCVVDARRERFGIRKAEVKVAYGEKDGNEFLIRINGTPILVKGTNWVFLDCMHSRDITRLQRAHDLMEELGCNMVRCWGGNVYESDRFYELCDERGVLVWQDFGMACGIYSQHDEFARIIEAEVQAVAVRLRNHPCIVLWAGDNEVDQLYINWGRVLTHSRFNRISREVLPRMLAMHDPYRPYIPSSPYIPEETTDQYVVPEQHNWGARDYYKGDFYKNSTARFISEAGYHGCPAAGSLKKFIPDNELWPYAVTSVSWRTHNSDYPEGEPREYDRNGLMFRQVEVMFGKVPEKMEDFILASQISQAEAKKFFVERTRLKKWDRTGILWWNLLDGWPQISDAVVDYYFSPKIAYYYLKRIHTPICLLMDESENWKHRVVLSNDSNISCMVSYAIKDGETEEILASGRTFSRANENVELESLPSFPGRQKLFLLEWSINGEGKRFGNHYISGFVPFDFEKYKDWMRSIEKIPDPFSAEECVK